MRPDRVRGGEGGQAAGMEVVPFAALVLIAAVLLAVHAWGAIDARAGLDAAARDYLRAYTSAPDAASARAAGRDAATVSLAARAALADARIDDPDEAFGPCRPATVHLTTDVPAVDLPFGRGIAATTVEVTATELVQPFGGARDEAPGTPTPCG